MEIHNHINHKDKIDIRSYHQ